MLPIIPVIDVQAGKAVHAVAGRRREYRPLATPLCPTGDARALAQAYADRLGPGPIYLADLDAIEGDEPAWPLYRELLAAGHSLWIDAGLADPARAAELLTLGAGVAGMIVGLETLRRPDALRELLEVAGADRLIFSLDLRDGAPLVGADAWRGLPPLAIAAAAQALGVRRFIVLDLAHVGRAAGLGTEALCQELRALAPHAEIISGGGVRSAADLDRLARAGCDAALVATALHEDKLRMTNDE